MPIITAIGRKHWKMRLLIWSVYAVLTLGSVTMIYPFLMMLSLSVSSTADFQENRVLPRYFTDEDALFRKYAATKYSNIEQFNARHETRYADFTYGRYKSASLAGANWPYVVAVPYDLSDPKVAARIADYKAFKSAFIRDNWNSTELLYVTLRSQSTINPVLDEYVAFLLSKYGSLDGINKAYYEESRDLREIYAIVETPTLSTYLPGKGPKWDDWRELKMSLAARDPEFVNIGDIEREWDKYLLSKYKTEEEFNSTFGAGYTAIFAVPMSFTVPASDGTKVSEEMRASWIYFAKNRCPLRYMSLRDPDARYREFLRKKYSTVEGLNAIYATGYASFDEVRFPSEITYNRSLNSDAYAFVGSDAVPPEDITIKGPRWHWTEHLKSKYGSLDAANAAHSVSYADWGDVPLPMRFPLSQTEGRRADWRAFVVTACPVDDLIANFNRKSLVDYLRSEYRTVEALNAAWGAKYKHFEDIAVPGRGDVTPAREKDLRRMLADDVAPVFSVRLADGAAGRLAPLYRDFLKKKYADIAAYNSAARLYPAWDAVRQPIAEAEWADFAPSRGALRTGFVTGNYKAVASFMAVRGRAFANTAILCIAVILCALTVNPLCAYALSRFQLSYSNSILLFLLSTMAFPVAVTQIPNFLMLKDLHLLNTFWALILPGMASGFSIFLLKGFFDSLPQELFEAGHIDGASEVQMFFHIALPLTTPILAVIALGAFTVAYGEFMWAFIVCQNPKYWTIMVFLYQFQQDYATPLVMAALTLASIPTLLVFIAAQKVILRGIVVPQMK